MKIFITGSSGFVGKSFEEYYKDHEVYSYRREDLVTKLDYFQPDLILNCAAEIYKPLAMWSSNVELTKLCLDYCVKNNNTKMIHIGSSSEYGQNYERATVETDAVNPFDMYSGTKAIATTLCQTYGRTYKVNVVTARPYSLYGPGEKPHRLFPNLWLSFVKGSHMNLVNGVHDYCYIDDFVDCVDLIVNSNQNEPGDVLNVSSGVETTNLEVLQTFQKVSKKEGNVTLLDKFATQKVWKCNNTKVKTLYGWSQKTSLEDGVRLFLEKANYE